VCSTTEAVIRKGFPVNRVVSAQESGQRIVADFIMNIAFTDQNTSKTVIHFPFLIFGRKKFRVIHISGMIRRPLFKPERIAGYMGHALLSQKENGSLRVRPGLAGNAKHQIAGNIPKPRLEAGINGS
jgi:hypothetical protein